jgi:hypothetical protein
MIVLTRCGRMCSMGNVSYIWVMCPIYDGRMCSLCTVYTHYTETQSIMSSRYTVFSI